ncbi:MAG TPA: class I SAM-dependent methyltransferase [Thermoanaerobaculia bacterium]
MRYVPSGARVLDIGSGHGVFSALARDRGAYPIGVDPDVRKHPMIAGYDTCIRGKFDAVAIIDVMYKIPIAEWDALLDRVRERLKPGGLFIVKEHDPTARFKQWINRRQESLATAAHLTLGQSFSYEAPAAFAARLRAHGFEVVEQKRIDFGYPHPHMLYVATHVERTATVRSTRCVILPRQ